MTRPQWLRKKAPPQGVLNNLEELFQNLSLNTVCREANCPNVGECFAEKTATFMILGAVCTRLCPFCNVGTGRTEGLDPAEPEHVAEAASELGLKHVVITSVTRDDLPDGGAAHFAATIQAVKRKKRGTTIEVLIPDFLGNEEALKKVIGARPEIIAHNLETVPPLYPTVRPQADYHRSLQLLAKVKEWAPHIFTKSGIILGLGEDRDEVEGLLLDLRRVHCDIVTIGQYLQPTQDHLPVQDFIPPEEFAWWKARATDMGFGFVASGPFVRSSYQASSALDKINRKR